MSGDMLERFQRIWTADACAAEMQRHGGILDRETNRFSRPKQNVTVDGWHVVLGVGCPRGSVWLLLAKPIAEFLLERSSRFPLRGSPSK